MILGLIYSINAAEKLKAAQDKYRISYNNLTKALKEGADQEYIDKLSAQCKDDYAEYQKAMNNKEESINKTSNYSVTTTIKKTVKDEKINKQQIKNNQALKPQNKAVNKIKPFVSPLIDKQVKIKIDGKEQVITITDINPEFIKDHPQMKKNSNKQAKRIGKSYDVPISIDALGYPVDPNDPVRCAGEKEVAELYALAASVDSDTLNYFQILQAIRKQANEIMKKYNKYPDICAFSQLYVADTIVNYLKKSNSFNYVYSSSSVYSKYNQLGLQYAQLSTINNAMKKLFEVIEDRKNEMRLNDATLKADNEIKYKNINNEYAALEQYKNQIHGGYPPTDSEKANFINNINSYYTNICNNYSIIYSNCMQMNDKEGADAILKIVKNSDGYTVSGKLTDAYKSMPDSIAYKYPNFESSPVSTIEVMVKMKRNAETFLDCINYTKGEVDPENRTVA